MNSVNINEKFWHKGATLRVGLKKKIMENSIGGGGASARPDKKKNMKKQ